MFFIEYFNMAIILSTTEKTFRFNDEVLEDPRYYCDTTFTVEKKQYTTGKEFYYITCKNKYSFDNILSLKCSPFYDDMTNGKSKTEQCYNDILIIVSNPMSDMMVKYLLMEYDELSKLSGNVSGMNYKIGIIKSLCHFWD